MNSRGAAELLFAVAKLRLSLIFGFSQSKWSRCDGFWRGG